MNYTVQKWDTLWGLSKAWGIPLEQLLAQVPESVRRDPRKLMPGMTLNDGRPDPLPPQAKLTGQPQTTGQGFYSGMPGGGTYTPDPAHIAAGLGGLAAGLFGGPLARGAASLAGKAARPVTNMLREHRRLGREIDDHMRRETDSWGNAAGERLAGKPYEPLLPSQLGIASKQRALHHAGRWDAPVQPSMSPRYNPNSIDAGVQRTSAIAEAEARQALPQLYKDTPPLSANNLDYLKKNFEWGDPTKGTGHQLSLEETTALLRSMRDKLPDPY